MALTPGVVVGFDLDMTLIDSAPGIALTLDRLAAETGVALDTAAMVTRLGPPLAQMLADHYPAEQLDALVDRFRELYVDHAIGATLALPGGRESLAAVRRHREARSWSPGSSPGTPCSMWTLWGSTWTTSSARSGVWARARCWPSTEPPSTSATTCTTSRGRSRPAPSASR